jgi:O-antigen/teichoic acid export membrane protein
VKRLLKSSLAWSFLAQFFKFGATLLVLPVALRKLTEDELGLWYVITGIGVLAIRADFGFSPTLARGMSYLMAGARRLAPNSTATGASIDFELVRSYVRTVRDIYLGVAAIAVVVLLAATAYLMWRFGRTPQTFPLSLTWGCYGLGILVNMYGEGWLALLNGANLVRQAQQLTLAANVAGIGLAVLGLLAGYGLLALTVSFLIGGLILRIGCWLVFRACLPQALPTGAHRFQRELFTQIWPVAWRSGLVGLGSYLIFNTNTQLTAFYFGLKEAASYGLSFQLFQVGLQLCSLPTTVRVPAINALRAQGRTTEAWRQFFVRHTAGLALFALGGIAVTVWGDDLLRLISTTKTLLPWPWLALMAVIYFLEFNHSNCATFILTGNEVPFVRAAVYSGLAIFLIGSVMAPYWGISGLLITVAAVQASWNNWWVPRRAWQAAHPPAAGGNPA